MRRDLAKEERICQALEAGVPAWQVANNEQLSTPDVYHAYARTRKVNWKDAQVNFRANLHPTSVHDPRYSKHIEKEGSDE